MEQGLVDSSKFNISLLSLDSRYADQRACENSEFKIVLPYPIKNVMRVRLASIELPLVEYLFSPQYGNTTLAVKVGTSTTFVKMTPVTPGNYTAVELLSALETNLKLIYSQFSVTMNQYTGRCTIRNTVKFEAYLMSFNKEIATRPAYWGIGYYLGFREGRIESVYDKTDGSYYIRGTSVINIQQNQYYLLQLKYPEQIVNLKHRLDEDDYLDAFAKIILRNGYFTIAFDDNSNLLRKEFTFISPVTIPFFTLKLLNPFGEPVDMLNVDWSVTLEITDVVSSRTYTALSKTIGR
jgi:hypothetical protein